jgi:LemA protein
MMIVALLVLAGILVYVVWGYNRFARMRNVVRNAWSDVEVMLERRGALIPNLVETVKGYSGYESETLEAVTKARTHAQGALGANSRAVAEEQLSSRVNQILAIAEDYPELKASANFIKLQDELKDTENKIASARQYYNAAVRDLNTMIETFPLGLIGTATGFRHEEFFSVDPAGRELPSVKMA